VFIEERTGKVYIKSSAFLQICSYLDMPWPLLCVFWVVPEFLRNFVYDLVAMSRYRLFGKRSGEEACGYNPGLRKKSLDWGEEVCDDPAGVKEV